MKPRVLCVDDEPDVLDGLMLGLRRTAAVKTASCVAEALKCLTEDKPYWVVISDVQLPGMSGSQLLGLVKKRSPLTQRILLTGVANLDLALNAINSGEVFRFLTKPCPADLVRDSVLQAAEVYAQRAKEKESSIDAPRATLQTLLEMCSDFDKRAVSRAMKVRSRVLSVSASLGCASTELEFAALVYGLVQSLAVGDRPKELAQSLLVRISQTSPTLRCAVDLLRQARPTAFEGFDLPPIDPSIGADRPDVHALRAVCELDTIEMTTANSNAAIDRLIRSGTAYSKQVIHALCNASAPDNDVRTLPLTALDAGMLLARDVRTREGALLLSKDTVLTETMLDRLLEYREHQLSDQVHVWSHN